MHYVIMMWLAFAGANAQGHLPWEGPWFYSNPDGDTLWWSTERACNEVLTKNRKVMTEILESVEELEAEHGGQIADIDLRCVEWREAEGQH